MSPKKKEERDIFFNVSLDLLCVANQAGYFVRLNPAFERVLGYATEELMAKPFLEFVHPEDRGATKEALKTLESGKILVDFTNRYGCKDATYRWLEWRAARSGNLIYAAARDVTERKDADASLKERLLFEKLLSDLSARFVNTPTDRVDAEIERSLKQILEFFQVERCGLIQILSDQASWQLTHAAFARGIQPPPLGVVFQASLFPYTYDKLTNKRQIHSLSKLDDLPAEASVDRQTNLEWGIQSCLYIPIMISDRVVRIIAIDSVTAEHVWPKELIPRLRLVGEIFADALERTHIRLQIEERLQFEKLLAELSGRFVNIPSTHVDLEINEALRIICEHLDFEISTLWQWTQTMPSYFTMTHLYRPLEGPPPPWQADGQEMFPWTIKRLSAGEAIAVSTDDISVEGSRDQAVWRHYQIKSTVTFPLSIGGRSFAGALSFHTTRHKRLWAEVLVKRLRVVSEIFANALARKQSDHALRESEERLRLASASAGVGLWILDLSTRQFWATAKALELFGLAPDYSLDFEKFLNLIHPKDREGVLQAVNQASKSDDDVVIEYRIVKADNSICWMTSRGRRRLGSSGKVERLMGVTLDITERKQSEAATVKARSMITALVESTGDLIWSVDPQRFGLLTFNSALRDYFLRGLGLKIVLGMSPEDMVIGAFTPLVAEKWRQFYLRALREGSFTEEYRVATGTKVLLLSFNLLKQSGEVFGISVFGKDITERKDMERKIQSAAQEWQTTFDNIPDLVMILDTKFRIVRINAAVRSYFGLPKEEIIGAHCYALLHGEEKPGDFCPYMKTLESKGHEEAEFHDDARKVWLRASTDPVVDDSGEVLQVIYTLKDITEQKRAEAEAFAARKELWRTDRLLRMGELTASLAHELNQPLTAILSNARAAIRFIKSDRIDMNELTEILEDIARDDKRAGDIIRSLRAMLRPEEGEQEAININDLLGETIALFNSEAIIRNIKIETKFADSLPPVEANRIQLQQVVINLLMNAAESMMDEYENRKIAVETCIVNGDRAQVAVRDYGTGIDEQELGRIFEPFFTTKHSGLGMGLSLARSIIEGQAGHIRAMNNPDGGATFYFELPGVKVERKGDGETR